MSDNFNITRVCPSCGGDGMTEIWDYEIVNGEPQPISPSEVSCHRCNGGRRLIGSVEIPQINDILDKCNDILDKCNDILEQVTE